MRKLLCGALLLASLALVPFAAAATVQLGATAPLHSGNGGGCGNCDDFQVATAAGSPSYAVPAGDSGVITSWSVLAAQTGTTGPFSAALLVFRPTATAGTFTYVGSSALVTPPADGLLHTYSISMLVNAGDVIGLDYTNVPAYLPTSLAGDLTGNTGSCTLTAGLSCTPSTSGGLMSVAATLQTPTAAFTPSATSVAEGATVSFDGSASTSPASITDYTWNFGDGTTLDTHTTPTATHTFATPGAHSVSLAITDSNNDTNQASATVTVLAPAPPAPSPTPTPSPQTPPTFLGTRLASTKLPATSKGKVTLKLACSSTATTSCRGTVALYSATDTIPKTATVRHPREAARLGSASFTIASGETAAEPIALDAKGRKLLAKEHFSARALITTTDAANRTVTTSAAVTVKLVAKSAHHAPLRGGLRSSLATQADGWFRLRAVFSDAG